MRVVAHQINAYLSSVPLSVCDKCVMGALGLAHLPQVQAITGALGTTGDFLREKGVCGLCGKGKLVTRRA